jgi:excisionase family DNA binding protein
MVAVITISEAAKQTNVGRATIYRYIESGKLSATTMLDGNRGIDTSELLRVFGEIHVANSDVKHDENDNGQDLRHENTHLRELLAAKDEHLETLKQALRLLEYKRAISDQNDQTQAEKLAMRLSALEVDLEKTRAQATLLNKELEAERNKGFFARLFKRN